MENNKQSSEDTQLMTLQSVPQHLVGKGLSSIDYSIVLAKQQQKIGTIVSSSDFEPILFLDTIGKTIMQVIGDLGVKTLPDKATEKRIIHYITNYYKDFSIEEIKKAFELAIVGELNTDVEHYNSFDLKYVCKILNTYRARRNKALEAVKRATPKLKVPEATQQQKDKIRLEFLETIFVAYDKYCSGKTIVLFSMSLVYDTLLEEGILTMDKSKWLKAIIVAKNKHKARLHNPQNIHERSIFSEMLKNYNKNDNSDTINRITKEVVLMDFFNNCKLKKVDLRQIHSKTTGIQPRKT